MVHWNGVSPQTTRVLLGCKQVCLPSTLAQLTPALGQGVSSSLLLPAGFLQLGFSLSKLLFHFMGL